MAKKKPTKKVTRKAATKKSGTEKPATKKAAKKKSGSKKTAKKTPKKTGGGKPGLYANIRKAQRRAKHGGRKVRHKAESGAPTENDFKKSARTAKKKS